MHVQVNPSVACEPAIARPRATARSQSARSNQRGRLCMAMLGWYSPLLHQSCNVNIHYALLQCDVERSPVSVYRHSPMEPPAYPACEHSGKTLKCRTLTINDVQVFHSNFYSSQNKIDQDSFILKHVPVNSPKRHHGSGKDNNKYISIKYFVKLNKSDKSEFRYANQNFLISCMYPKIGSRELHATICKLDKCHARNMEVHELNTGMESKGKSYNALYNLLNVQRPITAEESLLLGNIYLASSKSQMTEDRVTLFTWMEHEYKKGSLEISSAVWHCLTESDRVFGNIEKFLRMIPVICDPTQYQNVFLNFGKVVHLGEDCDVKNWKEYACQILKLPASGHFKFASFKRFIIKKTSSCMVTVTGEPQYNVNIGQTKVADIKTLLASHYGDKWSEYECCQFFKNLFNHIEDSTQREAWDGEERAYCERADGSQDQDFHI
ncbi:hypothetical protein PR048_025215 [Dryococelus australis]|uniref:Uncharacterized protein n=1 Tax=Dryococelus australis TaxID=614101 RepID=A0ABQ9GQN3_9NEOP|nr:hypothetical protein PR048_025215 [Dryococelus australis]